MFIFFTPKSFPHITGLLAVLWAVIAWLEWFLIPIIFPGDGGPVPHMMFAAQAALLFIGCITFSLACWVQVKKTQCWYTILYTTPGIAYVLFQLWRLGRIL